MLLNLEPPLGFGNKCPKMLAYKRFMKLNMPMDEESRVEFTCTLFSLIRESLKIKILNLEEVDDAAADQCDEELRGILNKIWPYIDEKKREMCVPRNEGIIINISDSYFFFSKYLFFLVLHGVPGARVVTTGKIYAALLMVGNYRNYKTILEKELEQVSLIICNFVAFLLKNIV